MPEQFNPMPAARNSPRQPIRTFLLLLLCLCFLGSPPVSASDERWAASFAERVIAGFLSEANRAPAGTADSRAGVTALIDAHFDVEELAARAIGDRWRSWKDSQRRRYLQAYRHFLIVQSADNLDQLRGSRWSVLGTRTVAAGRVAVITRLTRRTGREHDIEWSTRRYPQPRILSSIIDGVDAALRQREEFWHALDGPGGFGAFVASLEEGRMPAGAAVVP